MSKYENHRQVSQGLIIISLITLWHTLEKVLGVPSKRKNMYPQAFNENFMIFVSKRQLMHLLMMMAHLKDYNESRHGF